MTGKHFMAMIGFGFVVMWIATNIGYAILCLVGAALFYLAATVVSGELDLGEVQARLTPGQRSPSAPRGGTVPPAPRRPRVQ